MSDDLIWRITIEPGKCGGRPCIRGMRIRVTDVLDLLEAGLTSVEVVEELPDLELEMFGLPSHMRDAEWTTQY